MITVNDLYEEHGKDLELKLITGQEGLNNLIKKPEVHRPGLSLAGYMNHFPSWRILIFGKIEIEYLKELKEEVRVRRLKKIICSKTPAVILARNFSPPQELRKVCSENKIPLFRTSMTTIGITSKLFFLLHEEFAPALTVHGTLVEVFGMGLLLQGDSSVGKSEAALGLLERGHRLVADDAVKIKKNGVDVIGSGPELTRHMMEIRGIGIINVANLHGAVCVRPDIKIDLVVKLEEWDAKRFYDRVGLEEKYCEFLGLSIPFHVLPVKPGRDVILLLETIALNHRLKALGYNSAKEFNLKLLETIHRKNNNKRMICEDCTTCKSEK